MTAPKTREWLPKFALLCLLVLGVSIALLSISGKAELKSDSNHPINTEDFQVDSPYNNGIDSSEIVATSQPNMTKEYNTSILTCSWYENFNSWRVGFSEKQGTSWTTHERFNSTQFSMNNDIAEDDCKIDVAENGKTAVVAYRVTYNNTDMVYVDITTDAGASWTANETLYNGTDSNIEYGKDGAFDVDARNNSVTLAVSQANTTSNDAGYVNVTRLNTSYNVKNRINVTSDSSVENWNPDGIAVDCWSPDYCLMVESPGNANAKIFRTKDGTTSFSQVSSIGDSGTDNHDNVDVVHATSTFAWFGARDDYSNYVHIYQSNNEGGTWTNEVNKDFGGDYQFKKFVTNSVNTTTIPFSLQAQDNSLKYYNRDQGGSHSHDFTSFDVNAGSYIQYQPGLFGGFDEDSDNQLTFYRERAAQPGVLASTNLFSNAQDVEVDWSGDPSVFVKDIGGTDAKLYRTDTNLVLEKDKKICVDEDLGDNVLWNLDWLIGSTDQYDLENPNAADGFAATRNTTKTLLWTCGVSGIDVDGAVALGTQDLDRTDILTRDVDNTPTSLDANYNTYFTLLANVNDGHWSIVSDLNGLQTSQDGEIPTMANITDVAVEKNPDENTQSFCAVSNTDGTLCVNPNGGTIFDKVSPNASLAQIHSGTLYIENNQNVTKYEMDFTNSQLNKKASVGGSLVDLEVSKDGDYLYAANTSNIRVYRTSDMVNIVNSTDFLTNSTFQDLTSDYANNYIYVVDQTTLYKLDVFNHTTSQNDDANIVGAKNDEATGDTESTGVSDDEDATDDEEETNPFATPSIPGVSDSSSGIVMGVFCILLFAILFYVLTYDGFMALIGAGGGFLLAVAFGWIPTWAVILTALLATAVIVMGLQNFFIRGGGNQGGGLPPSQDQRNGGDG